MGLVAMPAFAQQPVARGERVGLIVVAHGADSTWNAGVRATVAQVTWERGPVRTAFLMGVESSIASWDSAVVQLQREGVERIVAVPFMVSTFGSHVRQIQYYAGALAALPEELRDMPAMHSAQAHASVSGTGGTHGGAHTPPAGTTAGAAAGNRMSHEAHVKASVPVVVTRALDDAPELGQALADRWRATSHADRRRPLMLVAHGPNGADDAVQWARNLEATAADLARAIAPQPVRVALIRDDAGPAIRADAVRALRTSIESMARASGDSVAVLPVLMSNGAINTAKLPADLAGLPVRYHATGLAPHPALARWIQRIARGTLDGTITAAPR